MAAQSLMGPPTSSINTDATMAAADNSNGAPVDQSNNTSIPGSGVPDFVKKLYKQ
ncbi:hypothetical protein BX616_008012, partial [Lobosporangium transversale]